MNARAPRPPLRQHDSKPFPSLLIQVYPIWVRIFAKGLGRLPSLYSCPFDSDGAALVKALATLIGFQLQPVVDDVCGTQRLAGNLLCDKHIKTTGCQVVLPLFVPIYK